jgi:hypothetical protein
MNDPKAVLADCQPLLDALYDVFEKADLTARSYLRERAVEFHGDSGRGYLEPFAFSMLVRYNACELLQSGHYGSVGFRFERLANNGMALEYKGYKIRVWKADEGEIPAPGSSAARQEFYQQTLLFSDSPVMKLAILWESFDDGRVALILAAPRFDGLPYQAGQAHWEIPVVHPGQQRVGDSVIEEAEVALDDFSDIDFNEKTGSGDGSEAG